MVSGTSSSSTPDRSRAATVLRRLRDARMRTGGANGVGMLFKDVGSVQCEDEFGPIVGGEVGQEEWRLLRASGLDYG